MSCKSLFALSATLLSLAACGGAGADSSSASGGPGPTSGPSSAGGACTVTMTGAVNKTSPCSVTAFYGSRDNLSAVSLSTDDSPDVELAFKLQGDLQSGVDLDPRDPRVVSQGVNVGLISSPQLWSGSLDAVHISSLTVSLSGAGGRSYVAHGTIRATATGVNGAPGSVTVTATF